LGNPKVLVNENILTPTNSAKSTLAIKIAPRIIKIFTSFRITEIN
jgi:hypothetical protein